VVVDEVLKVGEEVHWVHEMSSSVSTTAQPSFLKEGSRRCRRSARRLSTPATVSWGSRRSPSRRSRTTLTSRQSSKCRRNSSYRSRRVRPTTKMSTSTSALADRSTSLVPHRNDQSLDPPGPIATVRWSAERFHVDDRLDRTWIAHEPAHAQSTWCCGAKLDRLNVNKLWTRRLRGGQHP
jgi:hypothetical protein